MNISSTSMTSLRRTEGSGTFSGVVVFGKPVCFHIDHKELPHRHVNSVGPYLILNKLVREATY
jgi:hypothetical protein